MAEILLTRLRYAAIDAQSLPGIMLLMQCVLPGNSE